ncbi:hypothetical protein ACILG0_04210 [Pseudomonadota bacterium AL_CKDN230030165-1A_HGKHYDSX7]
MKDRKKSSSTQVLGEYPDAHLNVRFPDRTSTTEERKQLLEHLVASSVDHLQASGKAGLTEVQQWYILKSDRVVVRKSSVHIDAAIRAGLRGAVDSRKVAIERLPGSRIHGLLARIVTPRFRDRELKEELAGFQSEFVAAVQRGDRRRQLELRVLTPVWMLRTVIGAVLGAAVSAVRGKIGQ